MCIRDRYCTLFNYILDIGKIPKLWKKGEITPVYKKDSSLSKDNYRPLTVLPSLSKVFETLVHSRVSRRFKAKVFGVFKVPYVVQL